MISIYTDKEDFLTYLNRQIMKKIFLTACVAVALTACNSSGTNDNTTVSTDSTTNTMMASTTTYTPSEGDVTYRNDKLMVYKGNQWEEADNDQTVGNGVVVHTNGVVNQGDKTDTLTDGQVVSHTGTFFDKTGHAIKDAWTSTKKGVGEAGEAVGKAAGEAGEAVGNAASKTANAVGNAVSGDTTK